MPIVKRHFPTHHLSKADTAKSGMYFAKNVWPVLERYGVQLLNPGKRPRKYLMTEEAKSKLAAAPDPKQP